MAEKEQTPVKAELTVQLSNFPLGKENGELFRIILRERLKSAIINSLDYFQEELPDHLDIEFSVAIGIPREETLH